MGTPRVSQPFPFFKETEKNPGCCGCNKPAMNMVTEPQAMTRGLTTINDFGTTVTENKVRMRTQVFDTPKPIGDSYYTHPNEIAKKFEESGSPYKVTPALY
jgi:hypothetical protein